jgi:transposase
MLGPPKRRCLDQSIACSLESLVPPRNFYRFLEAKLGLTFVREWVHDCYAEGGRPSIDPIVSFKLQLILFFEGIRSERKLMETVALNLAHRWYLGYALDEPLPDHSSLTRIRIRLGLPIFERFFAYVVELCQEAGLVWGKELFFDATKVRANAAVDSLVPRWYQKAKAHLDALFADDPALMNEPKATKATSVRLARNTNAPAWLAVENQTAWRLLDAHRLPPTRPRSGGISARRTTP